MKHECPGAPTDHNLPSRPQSKKIARRMAIITPHHAVDASKTSSNIYLGINLTEVYLYQWTDETIQLVGVLFVVSSIRCTVYTGLTRPKSALAHALEPTNNRKKLAVSYLDNTIRVLLLPRWHASMRVARGTPLTRAFSSRRTSVACSHSAPNGTKVCLSPYAHVETLRIAEAPK